MKSFKATSHQALSSSAVPLLLSGFTPDVTKLGLDLVSSHTEPGDEVLIVHILEDSEAHRLMSTKAIKTQVQKRAIG